MFLLFLAALLFIVFPASTASALAKSCPAGVPVGTFKLLVMPVKGGAPLPLSAVNIVGPGEKLRYEPVKVPDDLKKSARVSVLIVPASESSGRTLEVLAAQPVDSPAEWSIPERASAVGVIFGPHGIDARKVASLVEKHPEIVTKLADYAEQTTRVEALVQTLSDYEKSAPDSKGMQSALQSFSSEYGVQLPALDPKAASGQQALSLLRALAPAAQIGDPISSPSDVLSKTGDVAGPLAATYFGTPVALAIGGAAFVESLRTSLFPPTSFRSAFAEPAAGSGMNLCTAKAPDSKSRARIDYLWMSRPSNQDPPKAEFAKEAEVPFGTSSDISVTTATVSELSSLAHARDWQLVSASHAAAVPVKVTSGTSSDTLSLDLRQAKLPPGQYKLAAKWDWTPFEIKGRVDVRPLGNIANVRVLPDSQDALISGAGPVDVQLTGTDFEFVDSMSLVEGGKNSKKTVPLQVTLPKGKEQGEQTTMRTQIDTAALVPGRYSLAITQVGGSTDDVAITIHPPNPELTGIPIRVNLGEPQQTIELRGKHLERIERISSSNAEWKLSVLPRTDSDVNQRSATVKLASSAQRGDHIEAQAVIADLHKPLEFHDVLDVAGPRPKILSAAGSPAGQSGVELREGEVPARAAATFSLRAENIDSHPSIALTCSNGDDTRRKLQLSAGDKTDAAEFDSTGDGLLFLSVIPGTVGDAGCQLSAQLTEADTGTSDLFTLGRIVRLPKIEQLSMTNQRAGASSYVATLTGQDLQLIARAGWNSSSGDAVEGIPRPAPGNPEEQTLQISVPWPPPSPQAPLYIWLRGENQGRKTNAVY